MHNPTTKEEIRKEIICNNKFITIHNKSIDYKDWHDAGVKYIGDLLNKNGDLLCFERFITKFKIKTLFKSLRRHP